MRLQIGSEDESEYPEKQADRDRGIIMMMTNTIDEEKELAYKKALEEATRLAETDALTGLLNRGGSEHRLIGEIRQRRPGLFCFFDVNDFKHINDCYGHAAGDYVLKQIAQCMKQIFDEDDILVRFGGDEFVIFSPSVTSMKSAQSKLDLLLSEVEKDEREEIGHERIRISLGAFLYDGSSEASFGDIYERCDTAMYHCKKQNNMPYQILGAGGVVPVCGKRLYEYELRDASETDSTGDREILTALSRMYFCSYYVDLTNNSYIVIKPSGYEDKLQLKGHSIPEIAERFAQICVDPADRAKMQAFLNFETLSQRMEAEQYIECEYQSLFKKSWCRARFIAIRHNTHGALTHVLFLVASLDHNIASELSEYAYSKKSLDALFNHVPGGVVMYEWNGEQFKTLHISKYYRELYGDSLVSKHKDHENGPDFARIHPDDREAIHEAAMEAINHGHKLCCEYRVWNKQKNRYEWTELNAVSEAQPDGSSLIYALYFDITAQKEAELRLEKSRASLNAALGASNQLSYEYDPVLHTGICYTDENFFGLPKHISNYPDSLKAIDLFHPDDADKFIQTAHQMDSGAPNARCDVRILKNGEYRWYSCMFDAYYDSEKERNIAILTVVDISDRMTSIKDYNDRVNHLGLRRGDALSAGYINLDRDTYDCICIEDGVAPYLKEGIGFEELMMDTAEAVVGAESRKKYRELFSLKNLRQMAEAGQMRVQMEYLFRYSEKHIQWLEAVVDMVKNPITGEIGGVVYSRSVQKEKLSAEILQKTTDPFYAEFVIVIVETDEYIKFDSANGFYSDSKNVSGNAFWDNLSQELAPYTDSVSEEEIREKLSKDKVLKKLDQDSEYIFVFDSKRKGNISRAELRFTYMEESHNLILGYIRDITDYSLGEKQASDSEQGAQNRVASAAASALASAAASALANAAASAAANAATCAAANAATNAVPGIGTKLPKGLPGKDGDFLQGHTEPRTEIEKDMLPSPGTGKEAEKNSLPMDLRMPKDKLMSSVKIGAWRIEIPRDGAPRLYGDETMMELLGVGSKISPEECYTHWFSHVCDDYVPLVVQAVEKIAEGKRAEVLYQWNHPTLGIRHIRCGGIADESYSEGNSIFGFHQDMSDIEVLLREDDIQYMMNAMNDFLVANVFFDLKTMQYRVIKQTKEMAAGGIKNGSISQYLEEIVPEYIDEAYREEILRLLRMDDLEERIRMKRWISCDYIDAKSREWQTARLIPVRYNSEGKLLSVMMEVVSIDEEKKLKLQQEQQLLMIRSAYKKMFSYTQSFLGLVNVKSGFVTRLDKDRDIVNISKETPYKYDIVISYAAEHTIVPADREKYIKASSLETIQANLQRSHEYVFRINRKKADGRTGLFANHFCYYDETKEHIIVMIEEITNREEKDIITEEANLQGFMRQTAYILAHQAGDFAMLHFDLQGFKAINAQFGFERGNELLRAISSTLKESALKPYVIARSTGDHFYCLIQKENLIYREIMQLCKQIIVLENSSISVTMRCGIYEITDKNMPVRAMCDRARIAEAALKEGTNGCLYYVFTEELNKKYLKQNEILASLDAAVENEEFYNYFQPIYDAKTKKLASAEALVRWIKADGQIIPPDVFIPTLEENGQISKVDMFSGDRINQLQHERYRQGKKIIPISINLSRIDLYNDDLMEHLYRSVKLSRTPREYMRFEITESAYTDIPEHALQVMQKLREYGAKLLIDDFGKGYSSLSTLADPIFDIVKLDMSFIRQIGKSTRSEAVITASIDLVHKMNAKVVAEGVETREQYEFLLDADCDYIQGYYFSKPLPQSEFEELLDKEAENILEETKKDSFGQ